MDVRCGRLRDQPVDDCPSADLAEPVEVCLDAFWSEHLHHVADPLLHVTGEYRGDFSVCERWKDVIPQISSRRFRASIVDEPASAASGARTRRRLPATRARSSPPDSSASERPSRDWWRPPHAVTSVGSTAFRKHHLRFLTALAAASTEPFRAREFGARTGLLRRRRTPREPSTFGPRWAILKVCPTFPV